MPTGVASMIGLTIANTGITRKTNAIAAISKLSGSPGGVRKPLAAQRLELDLGGTNLLRSRQPSVAFSKNGSLPVFGSFR
jgi:hypothetical protein